MRPIDNKKKCVPAIIKAMDRQGVKLETRKTLVVDFVRNRLSKFFSGKDMDIICSVFSKADYVGFHHLLPAFVYALKHADAQHAADLFEALKSAGDKGVSVTYISNAVIEVAEKNPAVVAQACTALHAAREQPAALMKIAGSYIQYAEEYKSLAQRLKDAEERLRTARGKYKDSAQRLKAIERFLTLHNVE